jgi:hypothetical protein
MDSKIVTSTIDHFERHITINFTQASHWPPTAAKVVSQSLSQFLCVESRVINQKVALLANPTFAT